MSETPQPDADLVLSLAHGHWMAAGVAAAVRHGCFDALAAGASTATDVAAACGLPPWHCEMLLEALVGMGLIAAGGATGYSNTPTAAAYLVRESPNYLGELVETLSFGGGIWHLWADFDRTVAGGEPSAGAAGFDADIYRRSLVNGIRSLTLRAAHLAVTELGLADRRGVRILDVGGGSGAFSEAVLAAVPDAAAVQVDGPKINADADARMRALGLGERFHTVDGRFPDVDLPDGPFDVVIYSAVAHLHDAATNTENLTACRPLLVPDGRLVFHDYVTVPDEGSELSRVTNLNWLLIGGGKVWPLQTVLDWFGAAGFECKATVDTGLWMTLVIGEPNGQ